MSRKGRETTDTELAVLRQLWRRSEATIRELTDALYPDGGHSHYATVQSLLDRLQGKGFVEREKDGRVNRYRASVSRAELAGRRLRATADALFDGSMAPLLTHLVDHAELQPDEISALRDLVDQLEAKNSRTSGEES
ncbi:MAG: BlaI/MecI/CopY family transcriptional regulator [Thermoanaerobaculales bacterium]|jgi:predicted transcriptional regulator|nr:BlaI/MecI/CopY family transcriptional regulator [Thermoanaerobaculales bacterium]